MSSSLLSQAEGRASTFDDAREGLDWVLENWGDEEEPL